jgi:hypothetical protein
MKATELDRKIRLVINRIWSRAGASPDPSVCVVSVSTDGRLIGHNEIIAPENDLERWVTFDLHIYRASLNSSDSSCEPPKINAQGKIVNFQAREFDRI